MRQWIIVAVSAVTISALVALAVWFCNPVPPSREDAAFRSQASSLLQDGPFPVELEWRLGRWRYNPPFVYFIIPVRGTWTRDSSVTVRAPGHPDFAVQTDLEFTTASAGFGGSLSDLELASEWKRTIDAMPPDRREAFLTWWPSQPQSRYVLNITRLPDAPDTQFPRPELALPPGVGPDDVYEIYAGPELNATVATIYWYQTEGTWRVLHLPQ